MIGLVKSFGEIQKYQICLFSLAGLTSKVLNERSKLSLTGTSLPEAVLKSYISPLVSKCLTTLEAIMCSITLHKIHVRELGR